MIPRHGPAALRVTPGMRRRRTLIRCMILVRRLVRTDGFMQDVRRSLLHAGASVDTLEAS
jgi:hypothetical protein